MTDTDDQSQASYFSDQISTFGDRVAAARRAASMDQEQLSRKLGIKLKTLHAWEDDVSEPRANKLQMLAGMLNVSLIWLLTGEGEGVTDPWEEDDETAEAGDGRAELTSVLADIRVIRSEYMRLGERMARLEKRVSKTLKQSS